VFTRKAMTDLQLHGLARKNFCVRLAPSAIRHPNAMTVATVLELAGGDGGGFRISAFLHGMGEALYAQLSEIFRGCL